MVVNSETNFGHGSSLYGVYHGGYGPGGERASNLTTTKPKIGQEFSKIDASVATELRNQAAKAEIVAEVDRIQKRKEIRRGTMLDTDREVLLSLSKILKALDFNDLELMTRINTLLRS